MSARRVFHSLLGMGALLPALSGNSLHAAEETTARSNPSINLGQDQLIAYYPFDGDANDASGNRLNPISNSDLNYSEGRKGEALLLDGKTFVELPLDLDPELFEHISLNYSLRLDELPEDSEFLKKLQSQSYFLSNAYQGFVSVHDVKGKPSLRAHNSGTVAGIDGRHVLYRERWVDVRIVSTLVEGTNQKGEPERRMRVQLDSGNYSSVAEQLYKPGTTYRTLIVGAWDKAMGWPARGAIDELRIVARAPTEAENQAWRQERNLPAISSSTQATLSAALPVRHQLPAAVTNFDSKQGLLAHFPFDGDAKPLVGDFEPLSVAGTRPTAGKIGQALEFDGQSFVELPIDLSFDSFPEQTVSVWLKTDKLDDLTEEQLKAVSQSAYPLSNGYNGLLHLDGVKEDAYFRGASGGAITGTSGKHRALADVWTHVAIVSKLVDGVDAKGKPEKKVQVEIHSGPYITTNIQRYKEGSTTPILTVGAWDASPSYGFHGALDDLRIYARALSAGEISALAAVGNPRTDLGNVAEIQDLMETSNHAISAANTVTPGSGGGMAGAPDAQLSTPGGTPVVDSTNPLDLVAAQQPATSTPPQPGSVIEATGQPLAGIGDIDMAPDPDLQQTQDRVAEFDENARPADWRLTRIISVNPQPAIPGQDIKFRIEIEKDDPLNLAGEAYAGVPYSGQLSLVDIQTSTNDSAGSLQMEVVWTVPEDIIPQSSLGQSPISHTVIISLFGPQETKLGDRDPTNNRMETEVVVNPWDWTFRGVPGISGSPGEEVPLTLDLIKSDPGDLVPVVRVHVQGGDAFPVYKELGTEHLKTNLIVKIPKDAPYCGEGSVFRRELVLQAPDGAELVDQVMNNNRASIAVSVLNPEGVYSGSDGDACEFDADTLHYPDNGKLTKVSGYAATANYETINLFSQQRRLKGIGSAHGGGKLCLVSLVAPGPGGNSSGYAEGNVIDRCNGNEEDWDYGDLSFKENWAVTGIQVCHEDSGNRVKAIRAWGKELQPDGTLGASERAKTFTEIAGCADWKQRRDCPTNTVATGARFHFDDGTVERPVDYLKGIQLICTRLEP